MKYLLTIFLSLFVTYTFADEKVIKITDGKKLRKIERDIKYFGKTNEDWRENKNNRYYDKKNTTNFLPNEFEYILDKTIDGIKVSGTIIPQTIGDTLNTHWGKSLTTFTRISDGKSFSLYINKIVFSNSRSVCEGYEDIETFDFSNCKFKIKFPVIIENDYFDQKLFNLKDIDNDGKKELLVSILYNSRRRADIIAYNIINTDKVFALDKKNKISVVYTPSSTSFENDMLIDGYYRYKLFWKARKGSYTLQKIEMGEY